MAYSLDTPRFADAAMRGMTALWRDLVVPSVRDIVGRETAYHDLMLHRDECAERLRTAFELFEAGLDMQRVRLRREHPDAGDAEIERRLAAWLHERAAEENRCPHLIERRIVA